MNSKSFTAKYKATISYIITIVFVNVLYSYLPYLTLFGDSVTPADIIVGIIYIARDFAQREIGHRVLIAMVIGSVLSYLMAAPAVAFASVVAFSLGETIDWLVYTYTRKPLSERLLYSAALSAPVDSAVFLSLLGMFSVVEVTLMTLAKLLGVLLVWYLWRRRAQRDASFVQGDAVQSEF